MSIKAFVALANKLQGEGKDLSTLVVSERLHPGTYDVTVKSVDTTMTDEKGYFFVSFVDEKGGEYREIIPLRNFSGDEFSYAFRKLVSGLYQKGTTFKSILAAVAQYGERTFEAFTGAKCKITLDWGKGYYVKTDGNELFAAYDRESGEKLTDDFVTIEEAKDVAEAEGHKQSRLRLVQYGATHVDENNVALDAALAGIEESSTNNNAGSAGSGNAGGMAPAI